MAKTAFGSVEEYIAAQPEAVQTALREVRRCIRRALPASEEGISYQIPTYKRDGAPVLYFAGWRRHYSVYPASERVVAELGDELAPYEVQKGTIRFPLAEPVPAKLIERIAKLRAREVAEGKGRKA